MIATAKYNPGIQLHCSRARERSMDNSERKWVRRLVFRDSDEIVLGWILDLHSEDCAIFGAAVDRLLDSMMDGLRSIVERRYKLERLGRHVSQSDLVQDVSIRLYKALQTIAESNPEKLPRTIELLEGLVRLHIGFAFGDAIRSTFGKYKPGANHDSYAGRGGTSIGEGNPEKRLAAGGPGPRTKILNDESWRQLPEAIAELPEDLREVCELKFFSGLNNSEIAQLLEISERTVRYRVQKAVLAMKSILGSE